MESCSKCELWRKIALENGYAHGICEECFNKTCVSVDLPYDPKKENHFLSFLPKAKDLLKEE